MMKTEDRRTRKTREAIINAVSGLMLERKFNELSVSEICAHADISRRTFYLHFRDIDDVFRLIFARINEPLYEGIEKLRMDEPPEADEEETVGGIFQLINETIERNTVYLARIATEPSYSSINYMHISLMKSLISRHLANTIENTMIRKIYLDYYVAGILELYMQWYRHEHDLSLAEIRDFAIGIIKADQTRFINEFSTSLNRNREGQQPASRTQE